MNLVFIAIGSNIGDRDGNFRRSIKLLEEECSIINKSSLYETEPVGLKEQNWFLNAVIKIETKLDPEKLLGFLLSIEKKMGRVRTHKNSPREIDLDILFYNNEIINLKNLEIPHPRLNERKFVLKPLSEISPNFIHPVMGISISEMYNKLDSQEIVNLYKKTF